MSDEPQEEGFDEPTAPAWMATFGDLMSLLLTFFVLLMSFASMDERKYAAVAGSMRDAFGVQRRQPGMVESTSPTLVRLSEIEASRHLQIIDAQTRYIAREQSLLERMQRAIEARELQRVVQAERSPRGVTLRMDDRLLFGPGSTELYAEAVIFLGDVAELIRGVPGPVSIEGHTDPEPAGSETSNWELSSGRAIAVLRHLIDSEQIPARRLRATAFGATRPIVSNETAAGRARNRRVEFVFLRTEIELTGTPGTPISPDGADGPAPAAPADEIAPEPQP